MPRSKSLRYLVLAATSLRHPLQPLAYSKGNCKAPRSGCSRSCPVKFKGPKLPLGSLFQCLITPILVLVKIQLSIMYSSNGSVLLCCTLTTLLKTVTFSLFSNFKAPDFCKRGADSCIQRQLNPMWQISSPSYPSQPQEVSYKENWRTTLPYNARPQLAAVCFQAQQLLEEACWYWYNAHSFFRKSVRRLSAWNSYFSISMKNATMLLWNSELASCVQSQSYQNTHQYFYLFP